jgi:hypothetical protein
VAKNTNRVAGGQRDGDKAARDRDDAALTRASRAKTADGAVLNLLRLARKPR